MRKIARPITLMFMFTFLGTVSAQSQSILTISNKSCRTAQHVIVDNIEQHDINPGEKQSYQVSTKCVHQVYARSEGFEWRFNLTCNYNPVLNQITSLVDDREASTDLPIGTLSVEKNEFEYNGKIIITNKSDCVEIQKIVANRGNCDVREFQIIRPIKFGQSSIYMYLCPKLLELKIYTSQGNDTFIWD